MSLAKIGSVSYVYNSLRTSPPFHSALPVRVKFCVWVGSNSCDCGADQRNLPWLNGITRTVTQYDILKAKNALIKSVCCADGVNVCGQTGRSCIASVAAAQKLAVVVCKSGERNAG